MRIYILSLTERKVIDKYTTNHSAIYDFILKVPLVRSLYAVMNYVKFLKRFLRISLSVQYSQ